MRIKEAFKYTGLGEGVFFSGVIHVENPRIMLDNINSTPL